MKNVNFRLDKNFDFDIIQNLDWEVQRNYIIWINKEMKDINIINMSDSHIKACLKLLKSRSWWRQDYIEVFEKEIHYRRKKKLNFLM